MGSHRPLGTPYNRLTERSSIEGRMSCGGGVRGAGSVIENREEKKIHKDQVICSFLDRETEAQGPLGDISSMSRPYVNDSSMLFPCFLLLGSRQIGWPLPVLGQHKAPELHFGQRHRMRGEGAAATQPSEVPGWRLLSGIKWKQQVSSGPGQD